MDEYTAEEFVESVAGVVFRLSTKGVCIVYAPLQKEYLLAKGRRWSGETRERAILRIVSEETGYPCRLPAVNMLSRALPPPGTLPGVNEEPPDLVRELRETREPFAMQQIRSLSSSSNEVKLTFWYIVAINEGAPVQPRMQNREPQFYSYEDVPRTMTFVRDGDLVKRAITIVENTYGK